MDTPEDFLEEIQPEIALQAEAAEEFSGIDRREFMLMSLVAAAATTFGANAVRAQGGGGAPPAGAAGAAGAGAAGGAQQQAVPPYPLGQGEPMAEQFMPYPGGTGALMEKLVKERGAAAFNRSVFKTDPYVGAMPTTDEDLAFLPAHRLSALIKAKKLTSVRITKIYLDRLNRLNPILNCVVTMMDTQALVEAVKMDAELASGKYRGPLHGIPYGLKDLFSTKGVPTTWGSKDFDGHIIDEDAEIVVRLRDAGAVLLAKLSTGMFAQGDQWFRGRTNNPWNLTQGSSGSSAGPSSATAAGCVAFGIGTETQGSIVSPAIRCGLSALRPTFGRVSRYGGMVLAWSMDRVGPICRTAEDCAMVFNAVHGVDTKDSSTVMMPFQFDRNIKLASLRIGVDPQAPKEFVDRLKELGMKPIEIGARPTVPGMGGGGLGVEGAAAFDAFVTRKAKEIGLDLTTLPEPGAGGRGGGGGAPASPLAGSDWNPRFVNGRMTRALDFVQAQRRRYVLITKWGEFMKDMDMFIGGPNADIGPNAQTGHPCVVVPYKFEPPVQGGGGGGRGGRGGAAADPAAPLPAPPPPLNPQPICAVITGALYNDDKILAVAHHFQTHDETVKKRPNL